MSACKAAAAPSLLGAKPLFFRLGTDSYLRALGLGVPAALLEEAVPSGCLSGGRENLSPRERGCRILERPLSLGDGSSRPFVSSESLQFVNINNQYYY